MGDRAENLSSACRQIPNALGLTYAWAVFRIVDNPSLGGLGKSCSHAGPSAWEQ
jgi:hypothetical protein